MSERRDRTQGGLQYVHDDSAATPVTLLLEHPLGADRTFWDACAETWRGAVDKAFIEQPRDARRARSADHFAVQDPQAYAASILGILDADVSRNASAVQTLLTSAQSSASAAENGRPVNVISLARRTLAADSAVPPAPEIMPRMTSVSAKRAVSAA